MGFLAGVVKELNRQEEIEIRSKEFMAELLERRKNNIIPQLMEREQRRQAKKAEVTGRVSTAVALGLSKEAASILEVSGQLELEIDRLTELNKKGELNKDNLKTLSEHIVESTDEDKAEAALRFVLQGDLSGREPMSTALVNALWSAESPEQFNVALAEAVPNMVEGAGPTITPLSYSNRGASVIPPNQRSAAQNTIAKSMANTLGLQLNYDDNGQFVSFQGEDSGAAQEILNNAYDLWASAYADPAQTGDPQRLINPIVDRIRVIQQQEDFTLQDLARNKEFVIPEQEEPREPPLPGGGGGLPALTTKNPFDENLGGGAN